MRLAWIFSLSLVACSSSSSDAPATDGGSTDAPVGGDTFPGDSSGGTFSCPPTTPTNGAPCTTPGPGTWACEYGGDALRACTTIAQCAYTSGGSTLAWIVNVPAPGCGTRAASCPAAFGDREGTTCSTSDPSCDYDGGRCGCLRCENDGGISGYWHCRAWSAATGDGCSFPRPLLGSPCTKEGASCDYADCCGGPSLGPLMGCRGGLWQPQVSGACSCVSHACP